MRTLRAFLAVALLALPLSLAAAGVGQVKSFGINMALVIELYNSVDQTTGQITQWPPNLNNAVVQATVYNDTGVDQKLCFIAVLQELNPSCTSNSLVWTPTLTTKAVIKAGATVPLSASDFELASGSGQGQFCPTFKDEFQNVDPSKAQELLQQFMNRKFKACLVPVVCGTAASATPPTISAASACTSLTIFTGSPGAVAQVAMLISPHNNAVPDCNLTFLWIPALSPNLTAAQISYVLEVREAEEDGLLVASINVPAGQTYYTWSPRDRTLTPGQKYWWRVIGFDPSGKTFGGPYDRGWNITKWFICGNQVNSCHYSLADVDRFVQANAGADQLGLLKGLAIKAIAEGKMDDPEICKLLSGQVKFTKISVTKK
jgi:hypothetical protein